MKTQSFIVFDQSDIPREYDQFLFEDRFSTQKYVFMSVIGKNYSSVLHHKFNSWLRDLGLQNNEEYIVQLFK